MAAEYATVPAERLASKPATLSHVESAAMPLSALSAMQGLFDHGHLLADAREAFERSLSPTGRGKVVLVVVDE